MSNHYIASLAIEKVERTTAANMSEKRDISEVTRLIIKADSLDKLVEKLGKHIEIIEE